MYSATREALPTDLHEDMFLPTIEVSCPTNTQTHKQTNKQTEGGGVRSYLGSVLTSHLHTHTCTCMNFCSMATPHELVLEVHPLVFIPTIEVSLFDLLSDRQTDRCSYAPTNFVACGGVAKHSWFCACAFS